MRLLFVFLLLTITAGSVLSQIGGTSTYKFLTLPNAARVASLGGNNISLSDGDLNLVYHNPSLLDSSMSNHLVLNYVNYFSDINYGYASYAYNFKRYGTFAVGIYHINYGKFTEADETGAILGEFYAYDYSLGLYYAKPLDSMFTVGVELKPLLSMYEDYTSYGIALDAGITYKNSKRGLTAAFVLKNMGTQIKPYTEGNHEPLPFEIDLGVTKKLRHAPLRISLLAHNLETYDLRYVNANQLVDNVDPVTGDTLPEKKFKNFADNMARHIILGIEFLPFKNFYVNFGYNYQRRQELKLPSRSFLVGMSWGIGVKISKFHFSYGRATYHMAGASNHFSITTNISDFYKKKNPVVEN